MYYIQYTTFLLTCVALNLKKKKLSLKDFLLKKFLVNFTISNKETTCNTELNVKFWSRRTKIVFSCKTSNYQIQLSVYCRAVNRLKFLIVINHTLFVYTYHEIKHIPFIMLITLILSLFTVSSKVNQKIERWFSQNCIFCSLFQDKFRYLFNKRTLGRLQKDTKEPNDIRSSYNWYICAHWLNTETYTRQIKTLSWMCVETTWMYWNVSVHEYTMICVSRALKHAVSDFNSMWNLL